MNCKDATHLLSEQLDRPLSMSERIQLGVHLLICQGCRNFGQHMQIIRHTCQALRPDQDKPEAKP